MKQARQIFWNALLLTAASLLMRTVGVAFQVALSNRAGAETIGLFSLLSGVYGFALTLATSGIHLGVTRVIVQTLGGGKPERVGTVMKSAVLYALFFGIASSLLLAGFAERIGLCWLKDARTVPSLRLLALTLPLLSVSSAFSGYFVAVRRVYKNAAVQVTEQGLRIWFTMRLLVILLPGGTEAACCALVLGGAGAEVLSFLLELILFLTDKTRYFPQKDGSVAEEARRLSKVTFPVAVTTYLRSGLVTLEHILIPEGLRNSGKSHSSALVAYGNIHSMALPVVLYPSALIVSFSGLLVPALTECQVENTPRRIRYMISRVWALSGFFSIGTAGILICFSSELGALLYPGTEAGYYIRILAPLIPVMYIDTATDAMLKGLGQQVWSMGINIADAFLSVLLVWFLIPRYGIPGYFFTVYFSETFNTVMSVTRLLSVSNTKVRVFKWIYKPLLAIVGATGTVRLLLLWCGPARICAGSAFLHVFVTLVLYVLLLLLTGCVEKDDLRWIRTLFWKGSGSDPVKERVCGTAARQKRRSASAEAK